MQKGSRGCTLVWVKPQQEGEKGRNIPSDTPTRMAR